MEISMNDRFRRAMCTIYEIFINHRGYDRMSHVMERPNVFMIDKRAAAVSDEESGENMITVSPTESVIIFLIGTDKLNIDGVKEMISIMNEYNIRHAVMVYQNSITSSARKALDLLYQYRIELFALHELQYDITKHAYFCPHEKVEDITELGFLKNQVSKLPRILISDPVVRYFGFAKGDILRIRRPNQTIAYRVVK